MSRGFKFQPYPFNGCQDILVMSTNPNGIAILSIIGTGYRFIINKISKNNSVNALKNADLTKKREVFHEGQRSFSKIEDLVYKAF